KSGRRSSLAVVLKTGGTTIEELNDSDLMKQSVAWLGMFMIGELTIALSEISDLDMLDQASVYDSWFYLVKDENEIRTLSREIINFQIGIV
ncbi:hypothetical protein, partial [Pectobacterium sp. B1J-3]|uniref:hypothetical protein n=1 Tax=Pectobacterium sp. B1J-3 TaxID=3385371 RepID=UPI0039063BA2